MFAYLAVPMYCYTLAQIIRKAAAETHSNLLKHEILSNRMQEEEYESAMGHQSLHRLNVYKNNKCWAI